MPWYGYIVDPNDKNEKATYKGSLMIQRVESPDASFALFAERFLNGVEALPQDLREQIRMSLK
jgi:hypothetical protein